MSYRRHETRYGPPLTFVAEKLGASLERIHRAHRDARDHTDDEVLDTLRAALADGLKAFCALWDDPEAWNVDLADYLLTLDAKGMRTFLENIERGGRITVE